MAPLPDYVSVPIRRLPRAELRDQRNPPPGALDAGQFLKRHAAPGDWRTVVDEPCILHDGQPTNPTVVYLHLRDYGIDLAHVAAALKTVRFSTADRTDGLLSTSRVFGYEPRNVIRKDYCGPTSMSEEHPAAHDALCEVAALCEHFYRATNPVRHALHRSIIAAKPQVAPWCLLGPDGVPTVFTSGIANKDNQLPYHFDRGNFEDVWSAMLVFKGGPIEGGWLATPEYDAAFTLPDHSLFMFDGQNLMHGVTPFTLGSAAAYRYSVVFYSLKGMWQCLVPGELERFRAATWERQQRQIASDSLAVDR